jgi:hypothetical protein
MHPVSQDHSNVSYNRSAVPLLSLHRSVDSILSFTTSRMGRLDDGEIGVTQCPDSRSKLEK